MKVKREEVVRNLQAKGIFNTNEATYQEYVEELDGFQHEAIQLFVDEPSQFDRIDRVITEIKKKADAKGLLEDSRVKQCIMNMNSVNKEIRISKAGSNGEKTVSRELTKITRPDAKIFKNVYVTDGIEETEIDDVIVTRNGIMILEVKRTKDNIIIDENGRILHGKGSCPHQNVNIGDSMERKRNLLGYLIEKELNEKGVIGDFSIDSRIVFVSPDDVRVSIIDNFGLEAYCRAAKVKYIVDQIDLDSMYSDEMYDAIINIVENLATHQKRFASKIDLVAIRDNFAEVAEMLLNEEPKLAKIKEIFNRRNLRRLSTATAMAATVFVTVNAIKH